MKRSDEIRARMAEIERRIREERDTRELFLPMLDSLKHQGRGMQAEIERLAAIIEERKVELFDLRRNMRESEKQLEAIRDNISALEAELERLRRELARVEAEENAYKRLMLETEEFDRITANAPWREAAFAHQVTGARQMAAMRKGFLGDKRGLGKTLQSVAYCDMLKAQRVLYILPKKFTGNLYREVTRWGGNRMIVHLADFKRDLWIPILNGLARAPEFTVIVNLEAWRKDTEILRTLARMCFDTLIVDEAHYINNSVTNAYKGVKALTTAANKCPNCDSVKPVEHFKDAGRWGCYDCSYFSENKEEFRSIKNILLMTGSGIINRPGDLWALLHLLDEEGFPKLKTFLTDFCTQITQNFWGWKRGAEERLTEKLGLRYISRTRESAGVQVPPQTVQYIEFEFDEATHARQMRLYRELEDRFVLKLNDEEVMPVTEIIAQITRLRQILTWPDGIEFVEKDPETKEVISRKTVQCPESVKIDRAVELIQELVDGGERIVLFSKFTAPLDELNNRLAAKGIPAAVYTGKTDQFLRDQIQLDFDARTASKTNPAWKVLLATFSSAGESVNFNAATSCVFLDREWNPAKEDQAAGRLQRIGQENETTVFILHCRQTIDGWMRKLVSNKAEMIEGFENAAAMTRELLTAIREEQDS